MTIPPIFVKAARNIWNCEWKILMNGLAPSDSNGNYKRPLNLQKPIQIPTKKDLTNRSSNQMPGLIVAKSCPWAHRAWLIYEIKGLQKSINLHIAQVDKAGGRWILDPPIKGCKTLQELYRECGNHQSKRATVPMLFDPGNEPESKSRLINNESAELVEILNNWPVYGQEIDLNPIKSKQQINNWQNLIQESINNGVYKCGFARNQKAYEKASSDMFSALKTIEENLQSNGPWLCGEDLTIADIRLFPTIIRWETIYCPLFKCSNKPITSFPNIIKWRKKIFNMYNIKNTCDVDSWRQDYFGTLFPLNPSSIIPNGEDITTIINH
ncbi:glutathione S-transferase family protein [Prochlorococcus marinus]|uniref:Glutathione-dependent reductase n=1 Tax=Prochlorococcus marinus XMU1408 TaxID=2213228 RepID=A0A318RJD4_PROMR|nr:glutathione S-transferase family protein [Prochlorococcus marinus]MBW3041284.1 glutathione-dependent reductase [Prochlorococcus marinus str. XMU1408]PYE03872.1 glutathione-dependent reductase [Prochlorococcus marinus XMU1408]